MHELELLDLWDRLRQRVGTARVRLLAAEAAGLPEPGSASVGEVNRALLRLWRDEFGDTLECVATCPDCGERLEAELAVDEVLARAPTAGGEMRLPTLDDLDAAAEARSVEAARQELARRCGGGDPDAMSEALEAADPHLAIALSLRCPGCGRALAAVVDVAAHVAAAVDRRARVLFDDVAELAAAYGWTEDDVLRLPPARRRAYAERAAR
jgi:hypothetical protein